MIDTGRLRQMPQMIEYQRRREPIPQIFGGRNLIGSHIDLDLLAKSRYAFRQRFDHVEGGGCGRRNLTKTKPSNASIGERFQLIIGDVGTQKGNTACIGAKSCYGIQGDAVVADIRGRSYNHAPSLVVPIRR
jgi:hypothetical protein